MLLLTQRDQYVCSVTGGPRPSRWPGQETPLQKKYSPLDGCSIDLETSSTNTQSQFRYFRTKNTNTNVHSQPEKIPIVHSITKESLSNNLEHCISPGRSNRYGIIFAQPKHMCRGSLTHDENVHIYCISRWCNLVNFFIGLTFKTVFCGETDMIYIKFCSEYYGHLILQQKHKTKKEMR